MTLVWVQCQGFWGLYHCKSQIEMPGGLKMAFNITNINDIYNS